MSHMPACRKTHDRCDCPELEAREDLAASQAREAALREALEDIARVAYRGSAAASLARAALAAPHDSTALDARLMRVAEAVREAILYHDAGPLHAAKAGLDLAAIVRGVT